MFIDAHSHIDKYVCIDEDALESELNEIRHNGIFTISNSMDLPSYKQNHQMGDDNVSS